MKYHELTANQQETIRKCYDFEINAIELISSEPNPYAKQVKVMGLWDAINDAVELHYN